MKNQAVTPRKADEIILRYANGIEEDIDAVLGSVLANDEYDERTIRIAHFLNAVLCNGGVVPIEDSMDGYHSVPCRWDGCDKMTDDEHYHAPDTPVCHHSDDEWVFNPCPACPTNQREAINRETN